MELTTLSDRAVLVACFKNIIAIGVFWSVAANRCLANRVAEMSGTIFDSHPHVISESLGPEMAMWAVAAFLLVLTVRLILDSRSERRTHGVEPKGRDS
jgi:hypothetical protein